VYLTECDLEISKTERERERERRGEMRRGQER
jgi:hypothetical protein